MSRQFLNVVMPGAICGGSLFNRIVNPVNHLFYPSTDEAQQRHLQIQPEAPPPLEDVKDEEKVYHGPLQLPPPEMEFIPSWDWDGTTSTRKGSTAASRGLAS